MRNEENEKVYPYYIHGRFVTTIENNDENNGNNRSIEL